MKQSQSKPEKMPRFFDKDFKSLLGKHVLIGITYVDAKGKVLEQVQKHGMVTASGRKKGIGVKLDGKLKGETFWLPPDLRVFQKASPAEYRLRSTGEVVVNPDLLATWTVWPARKSGKGR